MLHEAITRIMLSALVLLLLMGTLSSLEHRHFNKALRSAVGDELEMSEEKLQMAMKFEIDKVVASGSTISIIALMACGPPEKKAKDVLAKVVGGDHMVDPIYVKAGEMACHRVHAPVGSLSAISQIGFDASPLPISARVSSSLALDVSTAKFKAPVTMSQIASGSIIALDIYLASLPWTKSDDVMRLLQKWRQILTSGDSAWDHLEANHFFAAQKGSSSRWRQLARAPDQLACDWDSVFKIMSVSPKRHHRRMTIPFPSLQIEECTTLLLSVMVSHAEVVYIQPRGKLVLQNANAAWISQSGSPLQTPAWAFGLHGEGEIIGMADTGIDREHCAFRDEDGVSVLSSDPDSPTLDLTRRKLVQYIAYADTTDEADGHGTHVAGTAVGNPVNLPVGSENFKGMAYEAKLAFFDFGSGSESAVPSDIYYTMLKPAYDAGARTHSDSWGTMDVSYGYGGIDEDFDSFTYDNPDMTVVAAAGNCGDVSGTSFDCDSSLLPADVQSVLSPAHAKNVIAVGASLNYKEGMEKVAYFSSRGPTPDGRIKPDIVAPGAPILSASADPFSPNSCATATREGTSMSAPVVAGSVALIRQYFREGLQMNEPSAALIKAVLINSATAMSGVMYSNGDSEPLKLPPDGIQGWGLMALDRGLTLNSTKKQYIHEGELAEGEVFRYDVTIEASSEPDTELRVTLVWTDPPGSAGAGKIVIHDLDLTLLGPNLSKYYPNGRSDADRMNNVEKITLNPAADGVYTIEVSGTSVSTTETQKFAVVANGNLA